MKIAVGSKNLVKLKAVETAFKTVWPDENWEVLSIKVDSGVPDQPMSDQEAIHGAKNRAKQALKKIQADYGVGIEGGIQKIGDDYFDTGWVVVVDEQGVEGIGSALKIIVPPKMMELVNQGKELGLVNDIIFNLHNSKQAEGHFGLMTNNAIDRAKGYKDGVIAALSRFIHPDLF